MNSGEFTEEDVWRLAGRLQLSPGELDDRGIEVAQGDDGAVLSPGFGNGKHPVLTTDPMIERTHFAFDSGMTTPADVAWKVVARNLSDLAAMGALPHSVLVTLGVPGDADRHRVEHFMQGLEEVCGEYGAALIGGDSHRSELWNTTCTALGLAREPWLRSMLRPGDALLVTGELGLAQLGIALITGSEAIDTGSIPQELRARALSSINRPVPRTDIARQLQDSDWVSCIDLSDSLSRSLNLLADASGVDIRIEAGSLPAAEGVEQVYFGDEQPEDEERELELARKLLASSEDYELLLGVPSGAAEEMQQTAELRVTRIGEVTAGGGEVTLHAGVHNEQVESSGYDQF